MKVGSDITMHQRRQGHAFRAERNFAESCNVEDQRDGTVYASSLDKRISVHSNLMRTDGNGNVT
jgi:hypothetical protein